MNPTFDDIYFLVRGVGVLVLLAACIGFLAGFVACYLTGGRQAPLPRPQVPKPPAPVADPWPEDAGMMFPPRPVRDVGAAPPPEEVAEPLPTFERLAALGDAWEEEKRRKALDEEMPVWAQ